MKAGCDQHPHRPGLRRARVRRRRPRDARRRARAARPRRAGAQRRRRGDCTRCATRCWARWRWATSACISRRRDPRWKDADSRAFVRHCDAPWSPNVAGGSATATSPWSASGRRSVRMRRRCAQADRRRPRHRRSMTVSVKATTTETPRLHRPRRRHRRRRRSACWCARERRCRARMARRCWPRAIRTAPEDFFVEEMTAFEASGAGRAPAADRREARHEHLVRGQAHRRAGRASDESAIGYAGMKDRHAVTRQRFRVWFPKRIAPDIEALQSDDLRVLDQPGITRKLPRGALTGNRFVLRCATSRATRAAIEARLQAIAAHGVPNYFGEQRFGRGGDNVQRRVAMFAGRRVHARGALDLLSAARSEMFNACWPRASTRGDWNDRRSRARSGCWTAAAACSARSRSAMTSAGPAGPPRHPPDRPAVGPGRAAPAGRGARRRGSRAGAFADLRAGLEPPA